MSTVRHVDMNPFAYEQANILSPEQVYDYYIEDYNYSRFIRSKRNVFLEGERGTGKTMALRYNSVPVQVRRSKKDGVTMDMSVLCIHVPCNTPLTHRREHELMLDFPAAVLSEHLFVCSIMHHLATDLETIEKPFQPGEEEKLISELAFVMRVEFPSSRGLLEGLRMIFERDANEAQDALNRGNFDPTDRRAWTFSSALLPVALAIRKSKLFSDTHFAIMIDDAQDLNKHQIKSLNSWIAFRDNSVFSFKVTTTKVDRPSLATASGGTILEGHDFSRIDMEMPYQNPNASFGKLAEKIVSRRLLSISDKLSPDLFFPLNPQMKADLDVARMQAAEKIKAEAPDATPKQIQDYVYKFARANYFRNRAATANRPPYSGFELLVHMSTGVIRNLLEPCFWMYDRVVSEGSGTSNRAEPIVVSSIPPDIQSEVVLERSKRKWLTIKNDLVQSVEGCSHEDANKVYQLFDQLAVLFRERLLRDISEPRAVTFSISDKKHEEYAQLMRILNIARKGQLLYVYFSSAKELGRREMYYVMNRILLPDRGLDPQGQHARVSIKCGILWAAANANRPIEVFGDESQGDEDHPELALFA